MDADYLKTTVGDALAAALTSLAMKQPKDPVDFLGHYLLSYADHLEVEKKKSELVKLLESKINDLAKEEARKETEKEQSVAKEKKVLEDRNNKVASLSKTTDASAIFAVVLESIKEATGATGAYIGKKYDMGPEAPPVVKYLAASQGSEFVVGQTLRGPNPGAEEEETGEEGVTYRLWKELPPLPVPEDQPEDAPPPEPLYPEYLHVDNVIREGAIKFFGVPKLGAYLALPVSYISGLHDEGIGVAQPPAPSEEQEAGDSSNSAGGEGEPAAVPQTQEAPPPTGPVKVAKKMDIVLGVDTIGQARKFTLDEIKAGLFWSKNLATALERADDQLWQEEVVRVEAFTAAEQAARGPSITELKEKLTEALKVLEGVEDSPAKKLQEKTLVFDGIKEALRLIQPHLNQLSSLLIKPKALHLFKLLQIILTLFGASPETTDLTTWEAVRALIDQQFWERFQAFDPNHNSNNPSKADVEKYRGMLEGIVESEVEPVSLESYLLLRWLVSSLELVDALYEKQEADEAAAAAAKAAAEAAAEAAAAAEDDPDAEGEAANE